jgi:hypothetical protein
MRAIRIIAEQQRNKRWRFLVVYPPGTRTLCGKNPVPSLRTWASERGAIAAGRREFRL